MNLMLVTAPTNEPVTLVEAKAHVRVDHTDEDALIAALISAAREHIEQVTRRALMPQTWELALDTWPNGPLVVPLAPLQAVNQITYTDAAGTSATLPATVYVTDTLATPGRLALAPAQSWPSVALQPFSGVRIRFTAGYATASAVPYPIRQALLMLLGYWYEQRETVNVGNIVNPMPFAVDALLIPYRVYRFV